MPTRPRCLARSLTLLLAAVVLLLAAGAWRDCRAAQPVPMPLQKRLMWEAIADELRQTDPAILKDLRGVGAGSFLSGKTDALSDIDLTLGHPDPRVEKDLVARINQRVQSRLIAQHPGQRADINIIASRDQKFADLFRGETGQAFFLDYANKTGDGRACFAWSVKPGPDGAAQLVRTRQPSEQFWLVTQGKVPKEFSSPHLFIEDSFVFLARYRDASVQGQAMKAAKYLNNVDEFLLPGLEQQWGHNLDVLKLPPSQREMAKKLMELKGKPQAEMWAELKNFLGESSDEAVGRRLREFSDLAEQRLVRLKEEVQFMDGLAKAGRLKDVSQARSLWKNLGSAFLEHGGKALSALDALGIINAYYEGGPGAASLELTATAVSMGCPPAALAALAAEVARQVTGAAVAWAGDKFIFSPINESALRAMYAQDSNCYIFRADAVPFQSPFHGLTRETLSYRFTDSAMLSSGVHRYVSQAKSHACAWFATEGAGDITPRLMGQMMADLYVSSRIGGQVADLGHKLLIGERLAPLRAYRVWLDGQPVLPGQPLRSKKNAPQGGEASFELEIAREFALWRYLPQKDMRLYDVWGRGGGYGAVKEYIAVNTVEEHLTGSAPQQAELTLKGGAGWTLAGNWPGDPPAPAGGEGRIKSSFYISNPDKRRWVYKKHRLSLRPGDEARTPMAARLRLDLVTDLPDAQAEAYEIVIAAMPVASESVKPPKQPPQVRLSCDPCRRPLAGEARVQVEVSGGAAPYQLEYSVSQAGQGLRQIGKHLSLDGPLTTLLWRDAVQTPGAYRMRAQATDAQGERSDWAEVGILVEAEAKPTAQPGPVKPAPAEQGPCVWSTVAGFEGQVQATQSIITDEKQWAPAAQHQVDLPGPGALRITMRTWGKHEYANHNYGACRWRSRAVLSAAPETGLNGSWVAGGQYFPGVRDADENSYSWKVKAAGRVSIAVLPEHCMVYQWSLQGKDVIGCNCDLAPYGKKLGYRALGHAYQLKVEFKPCP